MVCNFPFQDDYCYYSHWLRFNSVVAVAGEGLKGKFPENWSQKNKLAHFAETLQHPLIILL
jgi:hypothetical protein